MSERPEPKVEEIEKEQIETERPEAEPEVEKGREVEAASTAGDQSQEPAEPSSDKAGKETSKLEVAADEPTGEAAAEPKKEPVVEDDAADLQQAVEQAGQTDKIEPETEAEKPAVSVESQAVSEAPSEPAEEKVAEAETTPEPAGVEKEESQKKPLVQAEEAGETVPGEDVPQKEPVEKEEQVERPAVVEPVEEVSEQGSEEFARMLQESEDKGRGRDVKVGDKVSGVLVKIESENSFIDFGGRSEGVIRTDELKNEEGELQFAVGDPLEAFVASAQEEVAVTRKLTQEDRQADMLYQAFKSGIPVEGRVDAVNKWGLGVTIQGDVRAFCPISQVDTKFVENAEDYRDKKMNFKIIEFRNQGRNIVVSHRALLEAERDKDAGKVRATLKKGAEIKGKITRLENFGAFVEVGAGIEGLVHVSELSHQRVNHPQEVLSVGDEVTVAVLRTKSLGSRRKERISLSLKALEKDPWDEIRESYPSGAVIDGKVDALEDFGAFVEVASGVRGLIHVSEIADRRIGHPREALEVGQQVKVVVLEVDARRKRLRLSIKQVESLESAANLKEFQSRQKKEKEEVQGANAMLDALKRAKLID